MLRPATDCFAAAGRLQSAWFRTNDPDLNNAVLVSIDNWVDAGSKDLYIYDKVHAHDPPDMGRRFWVFSLTMRKQEITFALTMRKQEMMRIDCGSWC